jgi:hypothetical protein
MKTSLLWGAILVCAGVLILWRTSRYDVKGWMWDSIWQIARRKRTQANPTILETKLDKIISEKSMMGRARTTAGYVVGHFMAQAIGLVAILAILSGMVLLLYGLFIS